MEKQGLCSCQKRDKNARIHEAWENCGSMDEDYAKYLVFLKNAAVGYGGGDNPSCTCNDDEDDPQYMHFLANTKPDGTSYVYEFKDENGLPVVIKYEEDEELAIHGVEKGQDDVREKYKLGESSKGLKSNVRENRELVIHGVEKGQDSVREKYKVGESSKGPKGNERENRMKDGILSEKRGNVDRDLDHRKRRIDVTIVRGKEQKMKDRILSKKQRNEDRDLDRRKHRSDANIVPGKEQQMKDWILSKRRGNGDRDLDNRNHRVDVKVVHGKKQKMNDGILSKKRGNEDRDLVNRNHIIDVNIIPGKEQKIQNDSKFMDAEVKVEPKEDCDSFKEAISESEVEILENVGAEIGRGSSSNPFVPSVERCLNLDATIIDSGYRKEVLNLLMRPYNDEEYKKLWKDIKMQLNGRGKCLLSLHKGSTFTQNGSKFMDAGVNVEPKEDFDSLEEGLGSSSTPFLPSVEHRQNVVSNLLMKPYNDEEYKKLRKDIKMQLPSSSTNGRGKSLLSCHKALEEGMGSSSFYLQLNIGRMKEVLNLLMRPYNGEEYRKLWKDIKMQLPSSSTNGHGKSLLSGHKDVNRAIKRTNHNKDKKLNIMRGFFFWLEHLTRRDAFQPWEDEECLRMMPGSS